MRRARQIEGIADGLEPPKVGVDIEASSIDDRPVFGILVDPYSSRVF